MEKISKYDIFDEVLHGPQDENSHAPNGATVIITPRSIISALTGAGIASAVAKHKEKQDLIISSLPKGKQTPSLADKGYYSQVENIIKNLTVTFTPVSVVYSVKDNKKDVVIDTISVDSDMSPAMRLAWMNKDGEYFKNILINKIKSDVQMVEQHFANYLFSKHFKNKKSGPFSTIEKTAAAKLQYESNPEIAEKSAEFFLKMANDEDITLVVDLDRPFTDYLDVEAKYDFLSYGEKYASFSDAKYLTPGYILGRLKVAYFPDRVLFVVDNKVIMTFHSSEMTPDEFDLFKKQDSRYFRKWFEKEVREGNQFLNIEKKAEQAVATEQQEMEELVLDPSVLFTMNAVNPVIYLLLLNKKYTQEWLTFEPVPLIKMIENDFGVADGLSDAVLNKIMSIRTCNSSLTPYEVPHAFEKVIRSFNNLPINWFAEESSDIGLPEIAFGLEAFDLVTPDDDTYDNFSQEVFTYIVNLLQQNNCVFFLPNKNSIKSPLHEDFYKQLNKYLLDANNETSTSGIEDLSEQARIIAQNEILQLLTEEVLLSIRESGEYNLDDKMLLATIISSEGDPSLLSVIKSQVLQNIEVDDYMASHMRMMDAQLDIYGLSLVEESING